MVQFFLAEIRKIGFDTYGDFRTEFRGVIDNMKIQTKSWCDVGKLRNNSKNDLYNAISKWHVKCRVSGKWKSFMN